MQHCARLDYHKGAAFGIPAQVPGGLGLALILIAGATILTSLWVQRGT